MLPLHLGHSTTSVAPDQAATMRFLMGKVFLSGGVLMGNSETMAPCEEAIFSASAMFSGG